MSDMSPRRKKRGTWVEVGSGIPAIRCPNCRSDQTKRITGGAKAGKALLIGLFAIPNMGKSYRCLTCKYRW